MQKASCVLKEASRLSNFKPTYNIYSLINADDRTSSSNMNYGGNNRNNFAYDKGK